MLSGYYTIASGLLTRQREIDVVGNNLVNSQTPGYQADRLVISSFEQELLTRMGKNDNRVLGTGAGASAAVVDEVVTLSGGGKLSTTGRELDVAIGGIGYFNIQGQDGQNYLTRGGSFERDAQGYLALSGVGRVLGTNGPIQLGTGSSEVNIDAQGNITNGNGQALGQLRITQPPENATVEKLENGLIRLTGGGQGQAAAGYSIVQGALELSNVDMNREMTLLMEAQRAYQACSSALQTVDSLNRKAATQIAAI